MTPPFAIGDTVRFKAWSCGDIPRSRVGTTGQVVAVTQSGGSVQVAAEGWAKPHWIPRRIVSRVLEKIDG